MNIRSLLLGCLLGLLVLGVGDLGAERVGLQLFERHLRLGRLLLELLDGDPTRVRSFSVRFAGSLYPGETIETAVWRDGDTLTLLAPCPERDGQPVLTHATMEIR